jgi:hypothetical protein
VPDYAAVPVQGPSNYGIKPGGARNEGPQQARPAHLAGSRQPVSGLGLAEQAGKWTVRRVEIEGAELQGAADALASLAGASDESLGQPGTSRFSSVWDLDVLRGTPLCPDLLRK